MVVRPPISSRHLVATAFLAAGAAKLADAAYMVQLFDQIGVGQCFRYVTGVEIAGRTKCLSKFFKAAGQFLHLGEIFGSRRCDQRAASRFSLECSAIQSSQIRRA